MATTDKWTLKTLFFFFFLNLAKKWNDTHHAALENLDSVFRRVGGSSVLTWKSKLRIKGKKKKKEGKNSQERCSFGLIGDESDDEQRDHTSAESLLYML